MTRVAWAVGGVFLLSGTAWRLLAPSMGLLAENVSVGLLGLGLWASSRLLSAPRRTQTHTQQSQPLL
jgi:hypothetical protein